MQVTYQTDSFLDKNRDYVIVEHCNLLSSSKCPFVSGLFASLPDESSRSSYKFSSVSSRFKVPQGFNYYGYLGVRIASSNPNFEFKSTESDQNSGQSGPRLNALGPFNICYLEGGIETKNMYIFFLLKQQLQSLMDTLKSTEPHYVRCVKPNSLNRPQIFENQSVLHQLRCGVSGT